MTHHIRLYRRAALDLRAALLVRSVRIAWEAAEKRLREWIYWQSRTGSTRRRECSAIDDVLRLCEPNYREMVERIVKGNIVRPAGHFDVPAKWRRR